MPYFELGKVFKVAWEWSNTELLLLPVQSAAFLPYLPQLLHIHLNCFDVWLATSSCH